MMQRNVETSTDIDVASFESLGFELDPDCSDARVMEITNDERTIEGIGEGSKIENIDGCE